MSAKTVLLTLAEHLQKSPNVDYSSEVELIVPQVMILSDGQKLASEDSKLTRWADDKIWVYNQSTRKYCIPCGVLWNAPKGNMFYFTGKNFDSVRRENLYGHGIFVPKKIARDFQFDMFRFRWATYEQCLEAFESGKLEPLTLKLRKRV